MEYELRIFFSGVAKTACKRYLIYMWYRNYLLYMYTRILFKSRGANNDRLNEKLLFPPQKKPQLMYKQVYVYKVYRKKSFQWTIHTYLGKGNMSLEFSVRH